MNKMNRYLTVWIFVAMLIGLLLGKFIPNIGVLNEQLSIGTTNIPLVLGLILMMYPPLAKVDYALLPAAFKDVKSMGVSLFLNWIVGPVLMFVLAYLFLRDTPEFMVGLILIGLARCIAMVLVWNDLAKGNREYAAMLVALNAVFQLFAYGFFVWLFVQFLPEKLGLGSFQIAVSIKELSQSVFVYLGIPFILGFLSRFLLVRYKGEKWFETVYLPKVSPITFYALIITIVWMFSLKGDTILLLPFQVLKIALPLLVYFVLMFVLSFFLNKKMKISYDKNAAIAFTATGNNFELAIAVSIAVFGLHSPQAFVSVIGPLIEVPVLIALVRLSLFFRKRYYENK